LAHYLAIAQPLAVAHFKVLTLAVIVVLTIDVTITSSSTSVYI